MVVVLAEVPLADGERPRRSDVLDALAFVDGVRVGGEAPRPGSPAGAVDGREHREVDPAALPAVARHEPLVAHVEGPHHVARAFLPDDLLFTIEGEHAHPATVDPAHGRDEREGIPAVLDARLGQAQVRREHDHFHVLVAEEVVEVEVEGRDRETRPALRAVAVEDEREEVPAARPLGGRGFLRILRLVGRARAIGEEEEAEGLVVVPPAGGGQGVEDVGAIVPRAPTFLLQVKKRSDEEVATFGRAPELEERPERRPAHLVGDRIAGVAEERPQLDLGRAGGGGAEDQEKSEPGRGTERPPARPVATARTQCSSGRALGSGTRHPEPSHRRWSSCGR